MNNIIILGCGYIGANLANYCATKKKNKVYLIGLQNYYTSKLQENIEVINMKTEEISQNNKEIFKDSIVIDATGNTNATTSLNVAGINCLKNCINKINLIDMLNKLNIKKYIFLSSGGTIYGNSSKKHKENDKSEPLNIYALEKVVIEEFLKINSLENNTFSYLILRLANPYGGIVSPNKKQGIIDTTIIKVLKQEKIDLYGDIDNIRDYIYIDELSEAVYKLAISSKINEIYNIGTGKGYSIRRVFQEIEKQFNTNIQVNISSKNTIDINTNILNIDKLTKAIEFLPKIEIEEGIRKIKDTKNKGE